MGPSAIRYAGLEARIEECKAKLADYYDRDDRKWTTRWLKRYERELDKKRNEFIAKKQAEDVKTHAPDSFDAQVLTILRTQAIRANIEYAVEPKGKK